MAIEEKQTTFGVIGAEQKVRRATAVPPRREKQLFPPDFAHGDVMVGELYGVFGAPWVERALFAVDDGIVTTLGRFDDYFLEVRQWIGGDRREWRKRWAKEVELTDRVIALDLGEGREIASGSAVSFAIDRPRLAGLERDRLGVVRDGLVNDLSREGRRLRGEIDLLSLVALTCRLTEEQSGPALRR